MFFKVEENGCATILSDSMISHIEIYESGEGRVYWGSSEDFCSCNLSPFQVQILTQALDLCVLEIEPPPPVSYDGPQPF